MLVVAVLVIVGIVVKMMVSDAAFVVRPVTVEVRVIDVRADVMIETVAGVEIIGVTAIVIALEFVMPIPYLVDLLCDVLVNALIDALSVGIMGFATGFGVEVLAEANMSIFVCLMTALDFPESTPVAEFSC